MTMTLSQADYWSLLQAVMPQPAEASGALTYPLPSTLGQGLRHEFTLREGLDLAIEDACFHDDLIVHQGDRPHPIEFTFEQTQYHLYGSGLAPREAHFIPGQVRILSLNVHIDPVVFQHWVGDAAAGADGLRLLLRSPHERYCERSGVSTPTMQMTVQQILNCPFRGLTQRLYLESKVWELMALLINDLNIYGNDSQTPVLKADDIERIHYASKLLHCQMLNPPSLIELARAVGINDHKLKVGFRQVFNTTVFGYLHDCRMERSRQLLESGGVSVTAAAHAVGFANRGHFAAAFRRKYGVNPGVYVRQRRA